MDETRMKDALAHVEVEWSDARTDAALSGMKRKRTRRRVTRSVAALLVLAAAGFGGHRLLAGAPEETVAERAKPSLSTEPLEVPRLIRLKDGSVVTPEDEAEIEVVADSRARVEVAVVRGRSRFQVPRAEDRQFQVKAGGLTIHVFAARFSVASYETSTEVWVHEGYVRVEEDGKEREVMAGENVRFSFEKTLEAPETETNRVKDPARKEAGKWREAARSGDFDGAYELLRREGRGAVKDHVNDLLLAADVARSSGHPEDAIGHLERVVTRHTSDARAPLAAFTLGRIYLDDLGQAEKAAPWFRKARAFAPRGPLAEDALAREVEALSRSGDGARARERAELYLQEYPDGHRRSAVRKYGGVE